MNYDKKKDKIFMKNNTNYTLAPRPIPKTEEQLFEYLKALKQDGDESLIKLPMNYHQILSVMALAAEASLNFIAISHGIQESDSGRDLNRVILKSAIKILKKRLKNNNLA